MKKDQNNKNNNNNINNNNNNNSISFKHFLEEVVDSIRLKLQTSTEKNMSSVIPWNWIMSHLLLFIKKYSSGISEAILLSELQTMWEESGNQINSNYSSSKKNIFSYQVYCNLFPQSIEMLTIDYIYENKSIPRTSVLNVFITSINKLPNTNTYIILIGNSKSKSTIEWYLHQKFYCLLEEYTISNLLKQIELRLAGCKIITSGYGIRLLPTEFVAFVVNHQQKDNIITSSKQFYLKEIPFGKINGTLDGILVVKVVDIKDFQPTIKYGHNFKQVIFINDSHQAIKMKFWDEQLVLSNLFKKGDYLLIEKPQISIYSSKKPFLEYGFETILFVLPAEQTKATVTLVSSGSASSPTSSQFEVPCDEDGLRDYKNFPERIYITDLVPNMINVSLFGKIVAMSKNVPINTSDRFPLRLCDSTGTVDITLWDSVGSNFSFHRNGQYVFLEGIRTSSLKNGKMYVNMSTVNGAKFHSINILPGLLNSPSICKVIWLSHINSDHFICRAMISGWTLPSFPPFYQIHSTCKKPIHGTTFCPFCLCSLQPHQMELAYHIIWTLDDGTHFIRATALSNVHNDILSIPCSEFRQYSKTFAETKLNQVKNREMLFSISKCSEHSGVDYRIDQVIAPNIISEIVELSNQTQTWLDRKK